MLVNELTTLFSSCLPPGQISSESADLAYYGKDVSKQFSAAPAIILFPSTVEQISAIMKICSAHRIAVVPSGGRTGYSGGATAERGEVVLSLERMNKVLEVNSVDATMTVEAGVTTEAVRVAAAKHNLFYPVDFTSKGSSQIGGNIATNAGGIRVIRYGNTRDWVLGLTVVLPSGEILELNGSLFKNNTGYDLRSLFIGSEGTLGVIARATLRLTAPPKGCELALCGAASPEKAIQVLQRIRESGLTINVFEYFERSGLELVIAHRPLSDPFASSHPCYFLIEVESISPTMRERFEAVLGSLIEDTLVDDVVISESSKQYQDLMALRELIGEVANKHYVPHKNDISVPVPSIPSFLSDLGSLFHERYPEYPSVIFGHVGDGNLHVNVLKPDDVESQRFFERCDEIDRDCFALVQRYRGSISAEHGVGLLKKPFLHFSRHRAEVELMRGIKQAFDPLGICNPGKIFDTHESA